MSWRDRENLRAFLEAAGLSEAPMGMFYSDRPPESGFAPKPCKLPTAADEAAGQADLGAVFGNFSCVMGRVWLARKKGSAAWFSAERFGCLGGAFYLGFVKPQLKAILAYVSSGVPGMMQGEFYQKDPGAVRRLFDIIDPLPAPKPYCVFKPLTGFAPDEEPEVVTFFARPEELTGLFMLAAFVTEDIDAVTSPWGAGCTGLATWARHYKARGINRAVLGGLDASCRKFYKTDEESFSMPLTLFEQMLASWPESFLAKGEAWAGVRKKIARSKKTWGEG